MILYYVNWIMCESNGKPYHGSTSDGYLTPVEAKAHLDLIKKDYKDELVAIWIQEYDTEYEGTTDILCHEVFVDAVGNRRR